MIYSSTRVTGITVTKSILAALAAAALVACGGGGGSSTSGSLSTGSSVNAQTNQQPGNAVPGAPTRVNSDTSGSQQLRAVGATSDGGYSVAWLAQPDGASPA